MNKSRYFCDPHGAIGYLGAKKYIDNNLGSHCIFLETAHFYKFYDEIKNIIGNEFNVPSQLESVLKKDKNSVEIIGKDSSTMWYVPLGLKKWFDKLNIKNVIELDWFQEGKLDNVEIICLPSQHWSKRSLFKSFDTLWSSWSLKVGNFKFWFAGDTGYNEIQFKKIGDEYGPFDLSAIPIGAYEPRWFMKSFHVNPEEAIFIHEDIKSEKSIGMHFGTFVLTTEPILEPIEKIKSIITNNENFKGEFMIPESGVIYSLDKK